MIYLLKKTPKNSAHACKTYHLQWFHKHLCIMDSQEAKTRNVSLQGENPPVDFFLLRFVPGLFCPSLRTSSPAAWETNQCWEDNLHLRVWPLCPCWESPGTFQPVSRTLLVCSRFLPVLKAFANKVEADSSRIQAKNVSRRGCGIRLNAWEDIWKTITIVLFQIQLRRKHLWERKKFYKAQKMIWFSGAWNSECFGLTSVAFHVRRARTVEQWRNPRKVRGWFSSLNASIQT